MVSLLGHVPPERVLLIPQVCDGVRVCVQCVDRRGVWCSLWCGRVLAAHSAPRYMAAVNFLDVTCRNGDGLYDDARMPCFWMDAMIFLAAGADTKR